jgi:hypothetical protein
VGADASAGQRGDRLNASDADTLGVILMLIGAALLFAPLAYWFWNSLKR